MECITSCPHLTYFGDCNKGRYDLCPLDDIPDYEDVEPDDDDED